MHSIDLISDQECISLQDLVPTTAIKVFKTSAWPEPADCMGQAALKGYLGRKSHVAQLNAAGKNMAMMHGWEVCFTLVLAMLT